jgi:hypothetical protein
MAAFTGRKWRLLMAPIIETDCSFEEMLEWMFDDIPCPPKTSNLS